MFYKARGGATGEGHFHGLVVRGAVGRNPMRKGSPPISMFQDTIVRTASCREYKQGGGGTSASHLHYALHGSECGWPISHLHHSMADVQDVTRGPGL